VLAGRWCVYHNTQRPHSSLGYWPPAPAAWAPDASQGRGKVESKTRFPLFHAPDYDCGYLNSTKAEGPARTGPNRRLVFRQKPS
jgi:hypothetical protein